MWTEHTICVACSDWAIYFCGAAEWKWCLPIVSVGHLFSGVKRVCFQRVVDIFLSRRWYPTDNRFFFGVATKSLIIERKKEKKRTTLKT